MKYVVRLIHNESNVRAIGTHRVESRFVKVADGCYVFYDADLHTPNYMFPVRHYYVERG